MALISDGDGHAAEAFDRRFRPFLARFIRGRVRPEHESDLVQEVLLAAFKQICAAKFSGASGLGTWIIGILKHKIADLWESKRKEDRIFEAFRSTPLSLTGSALDAFPDANQPSPDIAIEADQLLATLPKIHRVVLILKIREGWTTDQIAGAMNLPSGTVGRLVWEAKKMIQQLRPPLKELRPVGDQ